MSQSYALVNSLNSTDSTFDSKIQMKEQPTSPEIGGGSEDEVQAQTFDFSCIRKSLMDKPPLIQCYHNQMPLSSRIKRHLGSRNQPQIKTQGPATLDSQMVGSHAQNSLIGQKSSIQLESRSSHFKDQKFKSSGPQSLERSVTVDGPMALKAPKTAGN